jgi:hypothetical protein
MKCEICGKEDEKVEKLWDCDFFGLIESIFDKNSIEAHRRCLFILLVIDFKKLKELRDENKKLKSAGILAEQIKEELKLKGSVNITKDLLIYASRYNGHDCYFLKVTDYKKGYWAETPLNETLLTVFARFLQFINSKKQENETCKNG